MTVLAVDLAAKYSAACLMDDGYRVLDQFDSFGLTETEFVSLCCAYMRETPDQWRIPVEQIIIEDLPHGLSYGSTVKAVCRLQGRFFQTLDLYGRGGDTLFLAPATWRAHFAGLERGTGAYAVIPVASQLGYTPAWTDLYERAKGNGGKSRAQKIASDYCSAYLIGRWAIDVKKQYGMFDVPGTARYDTKAILKKDFDAQDH